MRCGFPAEIFSEFTVIRKFSPILLALSPIVAFSQQQRMQQQNVELTRQGYQHQRDMGASASGGVQSGSNGFWSATWGWLQ